MIDTDALRALIRDAMREALEPDDGARGWLGIGLKSAPTLGGDK